MKTHPNPRVRGLMAELAQLSEKTAKVAKEQNERIQAMDRIVAILKAYLSE